MAYKTCILRLKLNKGGSYPYYPLFIKCTAEVARIMKCHSIKREKSCPSKLIFFKPGNGSLCSSFFVSDYILDGTTNCSFYSCLILWLNLYNVSNNTYDSCFFLLMLHYTLYGIAIAIVLFSHIHKGIKCSLCTKDNPLLI